MIGNYKCNNSKSKKHLFLGLDTTLKFAYKDLTLVRANYDFSPEQAAPNLLPLKAGDVLAIVGSIQVRILLVQLF